MAALMASGLLVWVAAAAGVVVGAALTLAATRRNHAEARVHRILTAVDGEPTQQECAALGDAPGIWGQLYQRLDDLVQEKKNSATAFIELERARRHAELATSLLREGKDPLTELAELRVGPLHDLLEAARGADSAGPVVSRALEEEELVGAVSDELPATWPAPQSSADPGATRQFLQGIEELIAGLQHLDAAMLPTSPGAVAEGASAGSRTPAQLVDAVVHTAADGIEDLAAGLMRANELASVAERVTNRATLLALNAALEATRSGSEAFAAIAEETRRLAEFAREATDTISRLAGEIEYKVGETITAIHRTSEDAKSAVSALSGSSGPADSVPASHRDAVRSLLSRARALRVEVAALDSAPAPRPDGAVMESVPALEIAPRYDNGSPHEEAPYDEGPRDEPPSGEEPSDLPPDPPQAAGGASPTEYLHLLDRLQPGGEPSQ
jgi:hypothetical protein